VSQRLALPVWGKRQLLCSMRPGSGWFLLFIHFDDFVLVSNGKKLGIHFSDFLCS